MDDIFELAKAKALIGGGGKRTGTAVPRGVAVDRIYFNTSLTPEEVNSYLSQLTYYDSGGVIEGGQVAVIYASFDENYKGHIIFVATAEHPNYGNIYFIYYRNTISGTYNEFAIFTDERYASEELSVNGWYGQRMELAYSTIMFGCNLIELVPKGQPMDSLGGVPVGAENEKIKNVLSITPF